MYVWNSCEIIQILFAYFTSLIITEYIKFEINYYAKKKSNFRIFSQKVTKGKKNVTKNLQSLQKIVSSSEEE